MEKAHTQSWGLAGALIVVVAVLVAAALPGRSSISWNDDDPLVASQLSAETALVGAKQASGGLKIAGLRLKEKTYRVDLRFLAGEHCPDGGAGGGTHLCPGPHGLNGEVVGRTATGGIILSTRLEVSRECYHRISVGDPWASHPDC